MRPRCRFCDECAVVLVKVKVGSEFQLWIRACRAHRALGVEAGTSRGGEVIEIAPIPRDQLPI